MKYEREFVYSHKVEVAGEMHGIVTTPTGFDPEHESLPLILFLHGAGERGGDVSLVKVHGIPKLFSKNPDFQGLRVVTASPQCPDGMTWNHLAFPVMAWADALSDELHCDRKRTSVTGLSMGGFGAWEMLCTFPKRFSAGAPVCGGGLSWRCGELRGQHIRVYHGLDDTTVPVIYSQLMVNGARNSGADIDFFAFDKVGHNSWERAYEETDLIAWLAASSLENRA